MVDVRRNFRKNPITELELKECRWYAVVNDLIGGYAIATTNKPISEIDPYSGEFELGDFLTKEMAQHIADLHNYWWDSMIWESYYDNIVAGMALDIGKYYHYEQAPLPDGVAPLTEDDWFDYDDDHEAS